MAFMCKKCKKAFRKDMSEYDDSDEYCPHCDNHYVRPPLPRYVLVLAIPCTIIPTTYRTCCVHDRANSLWGCDLAFLTALHSIS
ncbi:hypothetical protein PHLCEN_2v6734 [Hermanssonia centrifuga]|uniref:Zinc finger protein n=1 Tax=Hermanssonia centrifuga TaxID=98765 RepID=A0A2R6NYM8_9APHY|nr:hypothetical protein PHLCEN_2v6734 [Hermanssonia centrifuga]